jgi:hypothetical protein
MYVYGYIHINQYMCTSLNNVKTVTCSHRATEFPGGVYIYMYIYLCMYIYLNDYLWIHTSMYMNV